MRVPILLTRPLLQSEGFADYLEEQLPGRFEPVIAPLLEITEEPCDLDLGNVQALLFTSNNGVIQYCTRWENRSIPALCVGTRTTETARALGLSAMSADGDVSALASLAAMSYIPDAGDMLHLRGANAAGDLMSALIAEGIPCLEGVLYDQRPKTMNDAGQAVLKAGSPALAPLFSARTAALFQQLADSNPDWPLSLLDVVCMSDMVANEIDKSRYRSVISAKNPSADAMIKVIDAFHPERD
jgi:uroporphyrinogen-III synthase